MLHIKEKVKKIRNQIPKRADPDSTVDINRLANRIEDTAKKIKESNLSDDALRCSLWENLLISFRLENKDVLFPRDIKRLCDSMASIIIQNVSAQKSRRSRGLIERINPFKAKNMEVLSLGEAIEYLISNITKEAVSQDMSILSGIKKNISNLNKQVVEQSGVSQLTDEAIKKNLITSGSLLSLMGGVQVAGFSAYILAAQASAIIPFVGGKTLVSLLFVITNPFFVIPAVIATGAITSNSLEKSIKQSLGSVIAGILALRGIIKKQSIFENENFLASYRDLLNEIYKNDILTIKPSQESRKLSPMALNVPVSCPNLSEKDKSLLMSGVEVEDKNNVKILKIFPPSLANPDNLGVAGLVFADFIYDIGSIDPQVIEATDFSRKADISDVFEFSFFSEGLRNLSEESIRGHHANLIGYTAERVVASQLIRGGHVVEIPSSASQPGYDLLVDGHEFQVKCIGTESLDILERHFDKYPDTPVVVNSEVVNMIAEKSPDWIEFVFYVEGYTHEKADDLLGQSLEAGQELGDYNILSSVAIVSAIKNAAYWKRGEQSFQSAAFNVALDSVSKGSMAIAGGFAGSSVGMLLFGPAGAYILGGLSTVLGATQGNIVTDQVDKILFPEREAELKSLADDLLKKCNKELAKKIALIDKKISMLSNNGISSYVKYRLLWEREFYQEVISRHESMLKNQSIRGNKKIFKSLKLSSESTVHPFCLQEEYKRIANALEAKVDRVDGTISFIKRVLKSETR